MSRDQSVEEDPVLRLRKRKDKRERAQLKASTPDRGRNDPGSQTNLHAPEELRGKRGVRKWV